MISTGDYFRNRIAKRSLTALVAVAFALTAQSALAGTTAAKKSSKPTATKASKPTVYDFGASWCVPCKKFAPTFAKVKAQFGSKADFQSIDGETPEGEKFAVKYGVAAFPTVVITDAHGKVVFKKNGLMDEKMLTDEVTKAVGK
jgi:thiol-disulfide isomerase/thioredoxin